MLKVIVAASVVLVFPAVARGGDVAMSVRAVPLASERSVATAGSAPNFNLLAVHWRGSGAVSYRVHRLHGGWRAWRSVDDDVRPNDDSREGAATHGTHDGNLDWTGTSDRAEFRTRGTVHGLQAFYLWSRVRTAATRRLTLAGSPAIVPRSGWQANEQIKRALPLYAPRIKLAVVHHTAGTNSYSPAQAAAIVRGIEVYHVKGNGWNDIGYNFLVDRFGTVYEGRYGGIERNVIGAHAEGFNTGTVGVALIGNYASATPPAVQQDALVKTIAWRLDVAHVDPLSTVAYTSGGNYKYRAGKVVTMHAVSGHRDTGPSECPGSGAYATLPRIAARVSATGLPKLYAPVASGVLGGKVRFQARLSAALPWTVTVTDLKGAVVAQGRGLGTAVEWTWSALVPPKGMYAWTIDAGPSVRPATGTIGTGRAAPPVRTSLTVLAVAPAVIAPAAAGGASAPAAITFTLGSPARVTIQLLDAAGAPLVKLLDEQRAAGANTFGWVADVLPDGRYTIAVTARAAGSTAVTLKAKVVVDRTLTGLTVTPTTISPNGDGIADVATLSFSLARDTPVRFAILRSGVIVATPFDGQLATGPHVLIWDGTGSAGRALDGPYLAALTIIDPLGAVTLTLPVTVDTTPPRLALLDPKKLRFQLSEPALVSLFVNGTDRVQKGEPLGIFQIPWLVPVTSVSAEAQDAGGNVSAIVKSP